jgi:TatD DNase family protein
MRFVDSHIHLDRGEVDRVVAFASSGGGLLLACGVDKETSLDLLRIAERNPEVVKPFVGVHPSEAAKSRGLRWLAAAAGRASGIGEVGLDPTYSSVGDHSRQMNVFVAQLETAQKKGSPVQVHSRGAETRCLEVLEAVGPRRVLMHWLESEEALPMAIGRGYFVSFGPALLYSKKLQRMAGKADPEQVLLESDSPVGYGPLGGVAGPYLIPSVAFRLAETWGKPFADVVAQTVRNAARFLDVPGKG